MYKTLKNCILPYYTVSSMFKIVCIRIAHSYKHTKLYYAPLSSVCATMVY